MRLKSLRMRNVGKVPGLFAVALFGCAAFAAAQAQQNSELPEVMVSAERRSADNQSVPLSVSTVSEEELRSLSLRGSADIAYAVPGLQFDQQGMGATPFIRGVGAMSGAIGNEAPVSMYVDGVYYSTANSAVFNGLDGIRQVEVLKGPQGTLFGRNATGGVIQVMTRDPDSDPSLELRAEYGSDQTARGALYATGGISETVIASLALQGSDQRDGWGRNPSNGTPTFRQRETGARGKLVWNTDTDTKLLFAASTLHKRGEIGIGYHLVPGSLGVDGTTGYSGFYNSSGDPNDRAWYRHSVASASVEHDFSALKVVSISSWQQMDAFFLLDQDATPVDIVQAPISHYGRTLTQEVQFLSNRDSALSWIAGLYYLNDVSAYVPLGLEGAVAGPYSSTEIHSRQRSQSQAIFGQATAQLTAATRLTLGGRYTRDERHIRGETLGLLDGSVTTLASARQNADWKRPTWRVALARDMTSDLMAYVSWDRGFKSGIYNLLTYASAPVDPEILDAYQVGIKSTWLGGRLRLNTAAFHYRYQNIQVEIVDTGATITFNAAAARIRGLDVDLEFKPFRSLLLRGAVALMHGRYTDFRNAPFTEALRDGKGALTGGNAIVSGDATGYRTVRSPSRVANVSGRYLVPAGTGTAALSIGYYYNSGFAWDPDNRLRQQAYGIFNVGAEWSSPDGSIAVRATGSNLNQAKVCIYATATSLGDLCSPRGPRALSFDVTWQR